MSLARVGARRAADGKIGGQVDEPAGHGTKSRSRASTNRPEKATLPIVISAAAAVLWWMLQR